MNNTQINEKAFAIWENFITEETDVLIPLIYTPLKKQSLLFIGLNPSFSISGFRSTLKGTQYQNINPSEFYAWRNRHILDWKTAYAIEDLFRQKYAYFNKFKDLSKHTNLDWEHMDLFFHRETSQNKFKDSIHSAKQIIEFGRHQLELSKQLIVACEPKIIVVANAFASDILVNEFNLVFNENFGYHQTEVNNELVPIFLASMLTGSRAMDKYSYQRLKWQLKITAYNL